MAFAREIRIRFSHLDSAGVVFFPRYFALAHDLFEDLLAEMGFSWAEWFDNPRWIAPFRIVEAEYLRPLRGGETCRASLGILRLGTSSATLLCTLSRVGERVAALRLVIVFVSRKTGRKIAIPPAVRRRLKGAAGRSS